MHVFTSVTSNYIPKASVLATTLKRLCPSATFHLVLSDDPPTTTRQWRAPFDTIIMLRDLGIPELRSWMFKHSLVELCTAVKGPAFAHIARKFAADRIYYFDPDIAVLGSLDPLERLLDEHSILLTPHLCVPEDDPAAVVDNEICSLVHGIYNLGFLAVRPQGQGTQFIEWWSRRLLDHCYDDKPRGLFTDQRWIDLAPAFFDDLAIVRLPQCNVATWNLTHRRATGSAPYEILINGQPLCFYHFSGFDSGAQAIMLDKYGRGSPVLSDLRRWYIAQCETHGQEELGRLACVYSHFDNGEPITQSHRRLYRDRSDLVRAFPDPFATADRSHSYYHWFELYGQQEAVEARPKRWLVDTRPAQLLRRRLWSLQTRLRSWSPR